MPDSPVALVSGGSRGLGSTLVDAFLGDGYAVATFSRSETSFIAEKRAQHGAAFVWDSVDITDREALRQFVRQTVAQLGGIDVLVNNAGIGSDGVFSLMQADKIDQLVQVNLGAAIHLTHACASAMLSARRGAVINISSVNAHRGHAGVAVYGATKAALEGLTRGLARELGPRGIRVNSVAPGYFESEMTGGLSAEQKRRIVRRTPLRRLGTTDDIVQVVRFLASPAAAFVTGQTVIVDGGITC
jgi:3-oxoacyl-[acyl-carrier protein] reductase